MAFAARFKGMKFVILTSIGLDLFNPTLNRGGVWWDRLVGWLGSTVASLLCLLW